MIIKYGTKRKIIGIVAFRIGLGKWGKMSGAFVQFLRFVQNPYPLARLVVGVVSDMPK
jgi:hypothetical protein